MSTASNLDWTRRIGPASEQNTGPSGAQSGSYYMLVDASADAVAGHRAMLVYETPAIIIIYNLSPLNFHTERVTFSQTRATITTVVLSFGWSFMIVIVNIINDSLSL